MRRLAHGAAEAAVVVAPRCDDADRASVRSAPRPRAKPRPRAARAQPMRPPRATRSSGGDIECRRRLARTGACSSLPCGGARRRRDRSRGAAAVGRRTRPESRCRRCARGSPPAASRSTSATVWAITVPMPVPMSCTLDSTSTRAVATNRAPRRTALVCTLAPHSDCATPMPRLTGPASRARRVPPRPADPLARRSGAPRAAPGSDRCGRAARAGSMPRRLGELVDRLLHAPGARRVARPAHRAARPGVGEDVVLRRFEIRAGVDAWAKLPTPAPRASRPCRSFRSEIAVSVPSRRAPMRMRCQVAGRLPASICSSRRVSDEAHRRARLARQRDRDAAIGAERRLRAEAAAHAVDDDAHLLSGRPNASASSWRTPAVNWVDM